MFPIAIRYSTTSVTFIDAVVFQPVPVVQAAAYQVSYQLAGVSGTEAQL